MTALAAIHVAKRDLGLDDDTYRDLLERETGKRSAKGMNATELDRVLSVMRRSGFKPASKGSRTRPLSGPYAKKAQALWIALWNLGAVDDKRDVALLVFFARQTGIQRTEWVLDAADGKAVIEALKDWCRREGVDWDVMRSTPDYAKRFGFQIALAQWEKLRPAEPRLMAAFWPDVSMILRRAVVTVKPTDAEWITVMNELGKRVRGLKAAA